METRVFIKGQVSLVDTLPSMPECDFIWIDASPQELNLVSNYLKKIANVTLHEQHLLDCANTTHPAFFDSMQDYDLLIFRALQQKNKVNLQAETAPIVFIMLNKLFVTLSENSSVIAEVKQKISDPRRAHPKQLMTLVYQILNSIMDQYLVLRDPLNEAYHYWQIRLLDEKAGFTGWHDLLNYKTNVQRLYIVCEQQLDAVNQWRQAIDNEINESFNVRLNDISDHIRRVLRFAYQLERQLESLMQLHYSLISTRTNEIMRVLTVISAIFMPLTLITGIFGMNFAHMPGLVTHVDGFEWTMLLMLIIVICLLGVFYWRKWI